MKLQSIVARITKHELNSIHMQVLVTQVLVTQELVTQELVRT